VEQRGHSKYRKKKRKSSIGNTIFVHHRIVSAVKRMVFIGERFHIYF
jgi:hypothetical protein